jgi:hypothetical protein
MLTPILGQAYTARSVNAADNRMINLFPEAIPEGGQTGGFLNRAPGLRYLANVGTGPIRGLWTHTTAGLDAYVVSGNGFYKIDTEYNATLLGTVSGTGPVSIADSGTQIFIACNPDAYVYTESTNTFAKVTDPDFAGAATVCYIDGYFAFNQPDTQIIWVTDLLDGTAINPLAFGAAESSPDQVVAVVANNREVWVFGQGTTEVWYDAATTPFPLAPIQGAYNEIGCVAAFSIAKLDNSLFWLGADPRGYGIVYRNQGYTGKRISTHAVEYAIQQYGDITDAVAYTYQEEGHAFYVLNFPTANKTWVYDVATNAWHERASWYNGSFVRHRGQCQMNFDSQTIVGDYENGNLYALDLNVYTDNGDTQKWVRSWRPLPPNQNNLKRTAQHTLQLDCQSGVGINTNVVGDPTVAYFAATQVNVSYPDNVITNSGDYLVFSMTTIPSNGTEAGQGEDPQVMLRWSDDGGHTWSSEHWISMGKIGEYGYRAIWRRLGMTTKLRDRIYEISGTDPNKITIVGAELFLSGTNA